MATTILDQLKKTLEDEDEKKEFMKLYNQLCSQVDYNACAHIDTIVQKVNQEGRKEIHRIVEEKIRPKEQQIHKLKRENGIARMVIQRQKDEIKRLEEENEKVKKELSKYMETECELSEEIWILKKEKDRWEDRFKQLSAEGRRPLCLKQIEEYKKENQELKEENKKLRQWKHKQAKKSHRPVNKK